MLHSLGCWPWTESLFSENCTLHAPSCYDAGPSEAPAAAKVQQTGLTTSDEESANDSDAFHDEDLVSNPALVFASESAALTFLACHENL